MTFLRSVAKEALDHMVSVTKYLCCLHIANTYACTLTLVSGPSMLPTLNLTGDLLLVERVSHKMGKVRPGDVVLVKSPVEPRKNLAKRVIALEGDKVTSFVDPLTSDQSKIIVVPRGHVWIQGDNLYASRDSRHYGPVPYGLIQGKVFCRLWPLDSFGSLDK
ncbi:hypothetical protein MLD38_022695 [Melastoma candidum]|uniref:Uncharacterized protein n=1 Tax=Melastoma candidum TaxID=119954 RepID=A0ACB9QP25_9MYRT|nr:hypothetical protein MLD38_022695 [Melastoma candidum]